MIDREYNFELLPSAIATDGELFGIGQNVSLDDGGFAPGSTDWAVQDSESSQSGTTNFGRDRLLGPTWSWQLHVNRTNASEARASLGAFRKAWHALHIRDTPGAVLPLRYQLEAEDGVRRIYGRPRRFEAPPDNRILSGYVPVSVDFKCVDAFSYSDVMDAVTVSLGEEEEFDTIGGFIFPLTFPYNTLPTYSRTDQVIVGGDAPAHPIIRFNGPISNPTLETDDWTVKLTLELNADQYVEVDTRPWANTVLRNGNASVAGSLGRKTRMHNIVFQPGTTEIRYSGFSTTSSTCEIRWASTWNSI